MDNHSSSSAGQINNMASKWSTADVILKGDCHFRAIQEILTPNIISTIPMIKDELDFSMIKDIPAEANEKWTEVNIFEQLSYQIARIAMRVFVGPEICRNEEWIKASLEYDVNVGTTVIMLRMFPPFLHPFLARLMPSWYRAWGNIKTAERIIAPVVRERLAAKARGDYEDEAPKDLLWWILEEASEPERNPEQMGLRMLVVGLAALHTTSMAMSHAIYDLCQHPEYFKPLRQEMLEVLREDGGWQKSTIHKLKLLDSFVKETQRWSPASLST
jgi:cytochrome P450